LDEREVTAPVPPEPPLVDAGLRDEAYARVSVEQDSDAESALLSDLLREMVDRGCSDLHLTAAARPTVRLNGQLAQLTDRPVLTPPVIQRMMYAIITQKQREKFEESLELDFAYALPGKARFRVNLYKQRDSLGAAFRLIPYEIKKLEELGLPPGIADFAALPRGFVLVTGPTGSGKSTTLASLIDLANRTRRQHIMTVEDSMLSRSVPREGHESLPRGD
jgi:twitching motility protein PilT